MTLDEALKAKRLLRLEPFVGWKPCGKLTGRYFYDSALDNENEKDIKVEVRKGWFMKEWVHLINLKEVKEKVK